MGRGRRDRIPRTVEVIGTWRTSPFFAFDTVSTPVLKSTSRQRSPSSSPRRKPVCTSTVTRSRSSSVSRALRSRVSSSSERSGTRPHGSRSALSLLTGLVLVWPSRMATLWTRRRKANSRLAVEIFADHIRQEIACRLRGSLRAWPLDASALALLAGQALRSDLGTMKAAMRARPADPPIAPFLPPLLMGLRPAHIRAPEHTTYAPQLRPPELEVNRLTVLRIVTYEPCVSSGCLTTPPPAKIVAASDRLEPSA
jgi:hypothetical protein